MTPIPKEPPLVSALRMKSEDYTKDLPQEQEEEEETVEGEGVDPTVPPVTDLSSMVENIEAMKGADRDMAIDKMIKKLQSLKS